MRRFQALKQELGEMGMFAPEYKKTIPSFVKTVGIVTAPTGAAIRDIMNISSRRNPFVQLILYPALVQGEGAVQSIVTWNTDTGCIWRRCNDCLDVEADRSKICGRLTKKQLQERFLNVRHL